MQKLFSILFITLTITSCDSKKNYERGNEECYNLKYFASTDKDLPEVDFDWEFFRNSKIEDIRSYSNSNDTCEAEFHFKTNIGNAQDVEVVALFSRISPCVAGTILNIREVYQIHISHKGLIFLDGKIIPKDSISQISNYFEKYYLDKFHDFYSVLFSIVEDNDSVVENVINEILKGYKSAVSKLSYKFHSKDLCNLSQKEFLDIKNRLKFKIEIASSHRIIPPPLPTKH